MKKLKVPIWVIGLALCLSVGFPTHAQQSDQSTIIWRLSTDRDTLGPVENGIIDIDRDITYLATRTALYQVSRDGRSQIISERPAEEARLALAPGGETYAWMIPDFRTPGLFVIRLMDTSGRQLAELQTEEFPYGFNSLYLGYQGNLIVTASPLDDWEGIYGRYRYVFWNREGERLAETIFSTRQMGFLATDGAAIVLLDDERATTFDAKGTRLWQLDGRFRTAALSHDGSLALLNPAEHESINQVLLFDGTPEPVRVVFPTPVYDLRISPDGTFGMVTGEDGRYFYLNPNTGEYEEGQQLPRNGTYLFISDVEILDQQTVAFGLLHRLGNEDEHTWPTSSVIVIDRSGNIIFQEAFDIEEPISSRPAIDTVFGARSFISITLDTTTLVELER